MSIKSISDPVIYRRANHAYNLLMREADALEPVAFGKISMIMSAMYMRAGELTAVCELGLTCANYPLGLCPRGSAGKPGRLYGRP